MRHILPVFVAGLLTVTTGCPVDEAAQLNDDRFPLEPHYVLPQYNVQSGQVATGQVQGAYMDSRVLSQPIGFSHFIHASTLQIQCEFCHSEARKSIHAGVPPVQTCMNCHRFVQTANPEVQKIHQFYCGKELCGPEDRGQDGVPIPWNKVHDLPDYVHFSHKRHVRAGVDCSECHGQVQLQGRKEPVRVPVERPGHGGDEHALGEHGGEEFTEKMLVKTVMVRESSLQMGWCLDCHATHPSITANYGPDEQLRRAELKDCWTCHK